jgi:hypothetical protein
MTLLDSLGFVIRALDSPESRSQPGGMTITIMFPSHWVSDPNPNASYLIRPIGNGTREVVEARPGLRVREVGE